MVLLFFLNLVSFSFSALGLSPHTALALILLMIAGSMINTPLTRKAARYHIPGRIRGIYTSQPSQYSGLAINVGGANGPLMLSVYLPIHIPSHWQVGVATLIMAAVTKSLARPIPGRGIVLPVFVPPMLSAIVAMLLALRIRSSHRIQRVRWGQ